MRYPKEIEPGTEINDLVQNIDYAPTFLDLAGVEIPDEVQGRSLRPLWNQKDPEWRNSLYYHYYEYPHGWHFVNKHEGVRTDRYKLIHFYEMDQWELYDLKKDPHEMNNIYGKDSYSEVTDSLKEELKDLKTYYDVPKDLVQQQ